MLTIMQFLTTALIYLALVLIPLLIGSGIMLLVRRHRGTSPIGFGPWKAMATLAIGPTILMIAAMVLLSLVAIDQAEFRDATSLRAQLVNALSLITFFMPTIYIGALITGMITGVKRQRAYILVFGLLAPILFAGWFLLGISLGCVTTGACL